MDDGDDKVMVPSAPPKERKPASSVEAKGLETSDPVSSDADASEELLNPSGVSHRTRFFDTDDARSLKSDIWAENPSSSS